MRRDQKCILVAKYVSTLWLASIMAAVVSVAISGPRGAENLRPTWVLATVTMFLTVVIIGLIVPNMIYMAKKDKSEDQ